MSMWQRQRKISTRQMTEFMHEHELRFEDMARYLGVSVRTVSRYLSGASAIPDSVSLLVAALREFDQKPLVPRA